MPMPGDQSSVVVYIVAAAIAVVVLVLFFRLLRAGRGREEEATAPGTGEAVEPARGEAPVDGEEEAGAAAAEAGESLAPEAVADDGAAAEPAAGAEPGQAPEPEPETVPEAVAAPASEAEAGPETEPEAEPEPGRAGAGPVPAWESGDYQAALQRRKEHLQAELAEVLARRDSEGRSLLDIELRAVTGRLVRGEQSFAEFRAWCSAAAGGLEEAAASTDIPGLARAVALLRAADLEAGEEALVELGRESSLAALASHYAGRLAEERADFEPALQRYQEAIGLEGDDPRFLRAAAGLARELGRFDEARDWLERFFELPEDVGTSELRALARHDLGVVYARDGQYGEAVELYRQALAALDEEHPQRGLLLHSLAETREKMGQYEEAGKLYIQAVQFNAARLGKHHPAVGTTLYKLAGLYEELEEDTKAEPLYRQSLAISRGIFGSDHPEIGTIMNNLAEVYRLQERYDEAEPLYRESLAIAEKNLGPDHLNVAVTLNNLAELCSATGRDEEAAELQERAFVIFQQGSPVDGLMELERDEVDVEELKGQTVAG